MNSYALHIILKFSIALIYVIDIMGCVRYHFDFYMFSRTPRKFFHFVLAMREQCSSEPKIAVSGL